MDGSQAGTLNRLRDEEVLIRCSKGRSDGETYFRV